MRQMIRYSCLVLVAMGPVTAAGEPAPAAISGEEAAWLATHPDAVVELSQMPPDQMLRFLEVYQALSPEEQQQLRDNAGELQSLSPEEQAWALENPDGVRLLGSLAPEERARLLELYRSADPNTQRRLRNIQP